METTVKAIKRVQEIKRERIIGNVRMLITRELVECVRISAVNELGDGTTVSVVVTNGNIREEL
jgi:hypothetical protein